MVHYQSPMNSPQSRGNNNNNREEDLVGLTAEEAGIDSMPLTEDVEEASNLEFLQPTTTTCVKCSSENNQDKENQPPCEVTYLDLDKTSSNNSVLREQRGNPPCLKRRRAVTDWETEEAVQSILPKRIKSGGNNAANNHGNATEEGDDSVFLDDAATVLSDNVTKELEESERSSTTSSSTTTSSSSSSSSSSAMEIDRITSLVSIFSFGIGDGKLNRSVSTPDLCSAQAKDNGDALQQRQFIAMTV